jgi:hypothetical protein
LNLFLVNDAGLDGTGEFQQYNNQVNVPSFCNQHLTHVCKVFIGTVARTLLTSGDILCARDVRWRDQMMAVSVKERLTRCSGVFLEKITGPRLKKKLPAS